MVIVIKKTDTKRSIQKKLNKLKSPELRKKLDAYKFLGAVKINGDPVKIQKKLRDEWN
jgi:hypothetical protein